MSYTNNWTQVIRQLMIESHTKEELMKLSNAELKKLHGEYTDKGDEDSQKEAKVIKDILDARGDVKEKKLEEGRGWSKSMTSRILRDNTAAEARAAKSIAARKAAEEAAKKKEEAKQEPKTVKEQNEELLMILDVLCEMIGVDMETLIEETGQMSRKDWQNFLRGAELDKPSPEGVLAAQDRMARVRANMKSLGKRNTRDLIPSGAEMAGKIEISGPEIHEPSANARLQGAPSVTRDSVAFGNIQRQIQGITDRVAETEANRDMAKYAGIPTKPTGTKKPTGKKPTGKKGKK